jgi:hypothetical protein
MMMMGEKREEERRGGRRNKNATFCGSILGISPPPDIFLVLQDLITLRKKGFISGIDMIPTDP